MFNVTRKEDPSFKDLTDSLAQVKTIEQFNYNALGQHYNDLKVSEIVDFPFNRDKQTSLIQQLGRRGLERNVDYRLVLDESETDELQHDGDGNPIISDETGEPLHVLVETAFITRLTTKNALMVVKTRGKKGEQEGAQLTDEAIPPTSTTQTDGDGDDGEAVAQQGGAPQASLGAPTKGAPTKPAAAPAKGAPAKPAVAPAKGAAAKGAPPKPTRR